LFLKLHNWDWREYKPKELGTRSKVFFAKNSWNCTSVRVATLLAVGSASSASTLFKVPRRTGKNMGSLKEAM